jgi:hypothetical protein
MPIDDVRRLRDAARDCLNVSKNVQGDADKAMLEDMAAELEAEAKRIEAEYPPAKIPTNDNGPGLT